MIANGRSGSKMSAPDNFVNRGHHHAAERTDCFERFCPCARTFIVRRRLALLQFHV